MSHGLATRTLTAFVLTVGLCLLAPAATRGQGAQTAVLQIRITVVAASSRCSVGTRAAVASPGTGAAGTAATDRTTSILDIRCGGRTPGSEKPDPARVFATGQISISNTDPSRDPVALTLRSRGGPLPDGPWVGVRPLVSYHAAPTGSGTPLINVEY